MIFRCLLTDLEFQSFQGNPDLIDINIIQFDSRLIQEGDLFIAVRGSQSDGHDFINEAINKGSSAIVAETFPKDISPDVCCVSVEDSSIALSIISSNFYNNPSSRIKLIGVTGTNGKTTVVTLLYNLFSKLGYKSGMLSTIENKIGDISYESTHTTSDALYINKMLDRMINDGCEYCFMEVSSHAIHQNRVFGLNFDVGLFTNITHEHLDYHKNFQDYIYVKKMFFDGLGSHACAITNKDDKNGVIMLANTNARHVTYGLKNISDYRCKILESRLDGMLLNIKNNEIWVKLIGDFNAYNLLAIYSVAVELGLDEEKLLNNISLLESANGRFHTVRNERNITGIIDYMHTPDAYKNVLTTINKIRRKNQKLIIVFGCGGDRDSQKRPKMTHIACNMSDQVIITSDNPRTEKIENIVDDMIIRLDDIYKKKILVITDRSQAIKTACAIAADGDIVLLAGKGHEKYQEIDGVKHYFDDLEELTKSLNIKF